MIRPLLRSSVPTLTTSNFYTIGRKPLRVLCLLVIHTQNSHGSQTKLVHSILYVIMTWFISGTSWPGLVRLQRFPIQTPTISLYPDLLKIPKDDGHNESYQITPEIFSHYILKKTVTHVLRDDSPSSGSSHDINFVNRIAS